MKQTTLARIAPILEVLRTHPALCEVRPAVFHLDGRDFIHVHDDADGIFADVLLSRGRIRMRVSTKSEQAELLEQIEGKLTALALHARNRNMRRRRKR